jgi:hypothetical protein
MKFLIAGLTFVALSLTSACGGGGNASPTPTPTPNHAPSVTATPIPTTTGPLTLDIASLSPSTVHTGDAVAVVFQTRAGAVIGLEVIDGAGNIVAQQQLTASSDGSAPYQFTATGTAGTWTISAAAGATVADLLGLQASPVSGANTVDRSFQVQ